MKSDIAPINSVRFEYTKIDDPAIFPVTEQLVDVIRPTSLHFHAAIQHIAFTHMVERCREDRCSLV